MKHIYELQADVKNYRWLTMVDDGDFQVISEVKGSILGDNWSPLAVTILEEEDHEGRVLSDFPYFGGIPTFSKTAVDALEDLLMPNGELLPLASASGEFYLYNVTRFSNRLDEGLSKIERFATSGRVKRITSYAFHAAVAEEAPIFKVVQMPLGSVFVTDTFVERVRQSSLSGFELTHVWSGV